MQNQELQNPKQNDPQPSQLNSQNQSYLQQNTNKGFSLLVQKLQTTSGIIFLSMIIIGAYSWNIVQQTQISRHSEEYSEREEKFQQFKLLSDSSVNKLNEYYLQEIKALNAQIANLGNQLVTSQKDLNLLKDSFNTFQQNLEKQVQNYQYKPKITLLGPFVFSFTSSLYDFPRTVIGQTLKFPSTSEPMTVIVLRRSIITLKATGLTYNPDTVVEIGFLMNNQSIDQWKGRYSYQSLNSISWLPLHIVEELIVDPGTYNFDLTIFYKQGKAGQYSALFDFSVKIKVQEIQ